MVSDTRRPPHSFYQGGLNAELFVTLLRQMMRGRSKPVHLVVDGLPAHKTALVKAYVASTNGMLTLHFLPGYAPDLNPDELVWSHMKRTGVARAPLRKGENLQDKITAQLATIKRLPRLGPIILPSTKCRLCWRLLSKPEGMRCLCRRACAAFPSNTRYLPGMDCPGHPTKLDPGF